ncbi:unnamed protein product [Blepharisma stoltei]|uniref:RING-type domain-containing protein n=1 Tax=Blepharisma stoltei TaxID=1481888 RepID=A0AAU9JTV0_9CILI|nr:unnamed protein product [Blepharisma stoltei]
MQKEQIFHESITLFRDRLADLITVEFMRKYHNGWVRKVVSLFDKRHERSKLNDLKTWDIIPLMHLLKSNEIICDPKFGPRTHLSFIKVIKKYRNYWAHQQPLEWYEVYRAVDMMILLLEIYGTGSQALIENRDLILSEMARIKEAEKRKGVIEEKKIVREEPPKRKIYENPHFVKKQQSTELKREESPEIDAGDYENLSGQLPTNCSICDNQLGNVIYFEHSSCKASICYLCIQNNSMIKNNDSCPGCRSRFSLEENDYINLIVEAMQGYPQ